MGLRAPGSWSAILKQPGLHNPMDGNVGFIFAPHLN
jgi:hypothetical protein